MEIFQNKAGKIEHNENQSRNAKGFNAIAFGQQQELIGGQQRHHPCRRRKQPMGRAKQERQHHRNEH